MKSSIPALALSGLLAISSTAAVADTVPTQELVPQMSTQAITSDSLFATAEHAIVPLLALLFILAAISGGSMNYPE